MNLIKSSILLPYIFYFLIGYAVTFAFLIIVNKIGFRNFVFIEACWIGSSISSYLFFRKYKRTMLFVEQSKVTWATTIILLLLSMVGFEALLHLGGNLEQKVTLLAKSLGLLIIFYGLWLSFSVIFSLSFFKLSANIIHRNLENPSKIIQGLLTISLTFFIADIIVNFLLNFLRH